jgi:hypothetical protein
MDKKIGRHILSHSKDKRIREVLELDPSTQANTRDKLLDKLRYLGDFYYNMKILNSGHGELIVYRRPQPGVHHSFEEYMPCKYCLTFLHRKDQWRHAKKCLYQNIEGNAYFTTSESESKMLLYPVKSSNMNMVHFKEFVLKHMKKDEITDIVRNDNLILLLGESLLDGKGSKKKDYISSQLRTVARLLQCLNEDSTGEKPYRTLTDWLSEPINFDDIIECTRQLGGYKRTNVDGESIPSFDKPSLPLKIGYALNNVLLTLKGWALRKKNADLVSSADHMMSLYQSEWGNKISSASLRTLGDIKFQKQELLPLTSDLVKLKEYCEQEISTLTTELRDHVWRIGGNWGKF